MKKMFIFRAVLSYLLALAVLTGMSLQNRQVFAESAPVSLDNVQITELMLTDYTGIIPPEGFSIHSSLKLMIDWDATNYHNNLKEGDFFEIALPKQLIFSDSPGQIQFELPAPDGEVMANATVSPDRVHGGGSVKVIFTNWVKDKENVKGKMELQQIVFNKQNGSDGNPIVAGDKKFEIIVSSTYSEHKIEVGTKPEITPDQTDEVISKFFRTQDANGNVPWELVINLAKQNLDHVVITDELDPEDGDFDGIHFIPESFILKEVEMLPNKQIKQVVFEKNIMSDPDLKNKLTFNDSFTKFTFDMGGIGQKQFRLAYKSSYRQGLKLHNRASLTSFGNEEKKAYPQTAHFTSASGMGEGNLAGKIKIVKQDADDLSKFLKGAKFKITSDKLSTPVFVKTNEQGIAISNTLSEGTYKIQEVQAPEGYQLSDEVLTIQVESSKAAVLHIKNQASPIAKPEEDAKKPEDANKGEEPKKPEDVNKDTDKGKVQENKKPDQGTDNDKPKNDKTPDGVESEEGTKEKPEPSSGSTVSIVNENDKSSGTSTEKTEDLNDNEVPFSDSDLTPDPKKTGINPTSENLSEHQTENKQPVKTSEATPTNKQLPKTGDGFNHNTYAGSALLLGASFLAIGIYRRRNDAN